MLRVKVYFRPNYKVHIIWTMSDGRHNERSGSSLVLRICLRIDYTFDKEYPFNIKWIWLDSDFGQVID